MALLEVERLRWAAAASACEPAVRSTASLADTQFLKQVDIRVRYQSRLRNPERGQQLPCYAFSLSGGVAVAQDDLDLQETPKPADFIKVNSRPVDHEELPPLLHDTPNAKRLAQDRRDGLGVGTRAADVQRFLRASEVWALIKNQLTRSVGELAKLQAAPRNNEKRIRLDQGFRRRWRKRPYLDPKTGQICYPRLHLDVSSQTHCRLTVGFSRVAERSEANV